MLLFIKIGLYLALIYVGDYLFRRKFNSKFAKTLNQPAHIPIVGSIWLFFGTKPDELLRLSRKMARRYGSTFKCWLFHVPCIYTSDLKYAHDVLTHPTEIRKNRMYRLLDAWLGKGLLLSNGKQWVQRRKVITPTFHFKILEEFVTVFNHQAHILLKKLEPHALQEEAQVVNMQDYVALATLDVICETAMGVPINAQTDPHCEYVRLMTEISEIIVKRFIHIPLHDPLVFNIFTPLMAWRQHRVLKALHTFHEKIIEQRRQEMKEKEKSITNGDNELGIKQHMALLDVLLSATIDGKPLTNADIREEVDTFMFEGHDTSKSGLGFTLYELSRNPDVQRKLYSEITQVLGSDVQQEMSQRQLAELKYTEKVIRETLRLYPSVPFIGRQLMHDCTIDGNCLPKGTNILLSLYSLQRDPEYFQDPDKFLPERKPSENAFVNVPFSAGPRNCIGQRFAVLEMKVFVARIIQNYELLPLGEKIQPIVNAVLTSKNGWQMGFRKRH